MLRQSQAELRERFRKRLVWLHAVTLAGVLIILGASVSPENFGMLRRIGVFATLLGGGAQIWISIAHLRRPR